MDPTSQIRVAPVAFQWLVFPLTLGGAVAGAMRGMANGVETGASILLTQLAAVAAVAVLAQLTLALVVGELPGYSVHRLEHSWDGLWRFHSTHHSAPRLYWLNAGRFLPLDTLLTVVPSYGLLVLLGCGTEALALFTLVTFVHGVLHHANLQMRLGPLNQFFSMAELHRWHHSKTMAEANHNYGQIVILWDTLFGTRFLPKDREPLEVIGLPDLPNFPMTWWAQIQSPFRWAKIRSESAAR